MDHDDARDEGRAPRAPGGEKPEDLYAGGMADGLAAKRQLFIGLRAFNRAEVRLIW